MFNIVVPLFHSVTVDSRSRGSRPGAGARAPAPPAPRRAGHGHGGVTAVRRARGARRRCGGVLSARRASVACTVRTRTRRAARAPRPARGATAPVGAQWPRAGPAARERHMQRPHTHTHTHTPVSLLGGRIRPRDYTVHGFRDNTATTLHRTHRTTTWSVYFDFVTPPL